MMISYNKIAGLGIFMGSLAVTGAVLLGLGLAGPQIGSWAGHSWQVITGGTLLGVGALAGSAFFAIAHFSQKISVQEAREALQGGSNNELWTYARDADNQEIPVVRLENGTIVSTGNDYTLIKRAYTRVCVVYKT
jgi:hypothetical protein